MLIIVNKFAKYCAVCGKKVDVGQGFSRKEDSGTWLTYCTPHKPAGNIIQPKAPAIPQKNITTPAPYVNPINQTRELTEDGCIVITPWTYDTVTLTLIKTMPGCNYDGESKTWSVSTDPKHRAEVIKIARKLNLRIHPTLAGVEMRADAAKKKGLYNYQISGVDWLNRQERAILGDEMGLGKAQPLSCLIATPTGWATMGQINVGDEVVGTDGKTHNVTGVFPRGKMPVFKVSFSDGTHTFCSDDHLWAVNTSTRNWRGNPYRVLPLSEIRTRLQYANGNNVHYIPTTTPVEYVPSKLPIDAYFMGYLIANGNLTTNVPRVTVPDQETVDRLSKLLPTGVSIGHRGEYDYSLPGTNKQYELNPLTDALRKLCLMGKYAQDKFIPAEFLFSELTERRRLLKGLMDGDGSVTVADNHLEYTTTSNHLANDVATLVQSLGGTAKINIKAEPAYDYEGEKKIGRPAYRVTIALPDGEQPFMLSRKADVYHVRTKYKPLRAIVDVEDVGEQEVQCISVDSPDHCYLTDSFIVTHNTVEAIMALEDKEAVIVVCPKNVLHNWKAEFKLWRPDYEVNILSGRFGFRWPKPGEIVVLNYEILPDWLQPKGKEKSITWKFEDQAAARKTVLLCDEAHALKNSKTGKHKKIKTLCYKVKKAWFLTGTPLTNKVNDLLGLLFALGRFNDTFGTMENFVKRFNIPHNGFGYDWTRARPDATVPDILSRVMLRRTREKVLPDLPDVTYQTLVINELSDKLRMQLDIVQEENEELLAFNELPPFELFSKVRYQLAKARIPAMIEFVEDCEEQDVPLVVFSAHRDPIDTLKGRVGWEVITGDVPAAKRQEIAERFQRGELRGIGQTIQTAIGSNLSHSYTGLFVDLDWTPALNTQAERRLLRIGQKSSKINIVQMVSNHHLDIHLHNLLNDKMIIIRETVG